MQYKIFWIIFMCWLFIVGFCNHANAGEFGPFRGKIIDAETKEPIEGVVVFMVWRQQQFWEGSRYYDAQETLTDKNGEFYIPGVWIFNPWALLTVNADVIIYKNGYGSIYGWWDALIENELGSPKGTYIFKREEEKVVIMLKKRSSIKEEEKYHWTGGTPSSQVPCEKYRLLQQEWEKEAKAKGIKIINCDEYMELQKRIGK